jgi:PIN domain nuclease of toxin-antitoxin system
VRLLLDTHVLIWAVDDPARLSPVAKEHLEDPANDLLVSAATVWELAIKVSLGKLTLTEPFEPWMSAALDDLTASVLPISVPHAAAQVVLPWHHRDPFDRLLAAQAQVESVRLVSKDPQFDQYGIDRVW